MMRAGLDSMRGRARLERNRAMAGSQRVSVDVDKETVSVAQALARPLVTLNDVTSRGFQFESVSEDAHLDESTLLAECKYDGYVRRDAQRWERTMASSNAAFRRPSSTPGSQDCRGKSWSAWRWFARIRSTRPLAFPESRLPRSRFWRRASRGTSLSPSKT
jgi:hypothetical protein